MHPPNRFFCVFLSGLLIACGFVSRAEGEEYRVLKNASGKEIRAKILSVASGKVGIQLENGQQFEIPLATLSPADQEFLSNWAPAPGTPGPATATAPLPTEGGVTVAKINEAIGQDLFSTVSLWSSNPAEVAGRLDWPRESKTAIGESYRAYPKDDDRFLGARPYSAALYGENDMVTAISIVFANKGDSFGAAGSGEEHFLKGKPVPGGMAGVRLIMANDAEVIGEKLTALLGSATKQRFGEGESRVEVQRWDWAGHAFLLSHVPDEYVSLAIQTIESADNRGNTARVSDAVIRERARGFVEKRNNGDVVISNIPMVDQGPKGYCVPATAERCMRFLGIPADMYLLAMAGETQAGGGTSVDVLLNNIGTDIKRKGRSFEIEGGELKLRDLKKSIDGGIPVMWALFSTKEFNETANERIPLRKDSWESYKSTVAAAAANPSLIPDNNSGHVVIIIGYNEETNEIAFSDSWGERYTERWITLPEAEQVSQKRFYVIGL
ncbi:MAG TPA: C39 family peptidase [Verrucomicrobiales bacterium]|nr:C39 family peptidase [Verrucomicrobiales bacterium]